MTAYYHNKLKRKIKFENEAILNNITNSNLCQLTEVYIDQTNQFNKSQSNQLINNNFQLGLETCKVKGSDDLKDHIEEYFESKKSSRGIKAIKNDVYRENGFHNILQSYLLSNETEDKQSEDTEDKYSIIKSIVNSSKSKNDTCQKERRDTKRENSAVNVKLSHADSYNGNKYSEKLTQDTSIYKSINNYHSTSSSNTKINVSKKISTKDFQNQFSHMKMSDFDKNTKETYYYLNEHIPNLITPNSNNGKKKKYSAIPLIKEMILSLFKGKIKDINNNNNNSNSQVSPHYLNNKIPNQHNNCVFGNRYESMHQHRSFLYNSMNSGPIKAYNKQINIKRRDNNRGSLSVCHQKNISFNNTLFNESFQVHQKKGNINKINDNSTQTLSINRISNNKRQHKSLIENYKEKKTVSQNRYITLRDKTKNDNEKNIICTSTLKKKLLKIGSIN